LKKDKSLKKNLMRKTTFVASILFATQLIYSQETIPTSGGDATGSGGSASYSVGQIVYTTHTGSNGSISQGVQQSYEIFTLSNAALSTVNLTATTYPNPTSDYVVLAISDASLTGLSYEVFDVQGKPIARATIFSKDTQIEMHSLSAGTYLLNVNQNNQKLKSFKIIKK
jgi:hypothetical protein